MIENDLFTKSEILNMLDVFFITKRITENQYLELVAMLGEIGGE